ncbi:hypothetical protein H257_04281 [Aphanomyces astaci]|uniref:Uncharacterized protein n=1 Tax=Aphanomyces astaci TaxID=112090 RepID=W4GXG5_APHAT|nr:hypothetical protein H257_04281 [Aphanomyces astaci]ETV83583.1 hypothetical protein H257_04281 [Aphanomyces astaci]|eukprot:XP_009827013.1 hypothetical protein H257_04281 [Aphanomyces astaci]
MTTCAIPPDLPPLEFLEEVELLSVEPSSSTSTKSSSMCEKMFKPAAAASSESNAYQPSPTENPIFVHVVMMALILYLGACAYAYLCPPTTVPWEVEFALPMQNLSSNCSVNIVHPFEGQVTSKNVIEFELHAPSNTTNTSQIMQYTIHVDGVLLITDLAILHRGNPTPFTTDRLQALTNGDHVVTITLVVPLPGGREDVVHVERQFHFVPPGSRIVKLSLAKELRRSITTLNTCNVHADSCNVIRAPLNGTSFPANSTIAFEVDTAALPRLGMAVLLDGIKVKTLPAQPSSYLTSKDQVQCRGVLVGLHPGTHTLQVVPLDDIPLTPVATAKVVFHVMAE